MEGLLTALIFSLARGHQQQKRQQDARENTARAPSEPSPSCRASYVDGHEAPGQQAAVPLSQATEVVMECASLALCVCTAKLLTHPKLVRVVIMRAHRACRSALKLALTPLGLAARWVSSFKLLWMSVTSERSRTHE